MPHSSAVVLDHEIRTISEEINQLLALPVLSQSQRKRADLLLAQLSVKRGQKLEAAETRAEKEYRENFRRYMCGDPSVELRGDLVAGTETPSWSAGAEGGYLVPPSFSAHVVEGMAQSDPLLDESVVTLIQEDGFKLPPLQVPAFDLSSVKASKVSEGSQQNSGVVPPTSQKLTNRFLYKLTLGASFEWQEDSRAYDTAEAAVARAFGVGVARAIGEDLAVGDGSTAPGGLAQAHDSGYTTAAGGVISAVDIESIYFSLDRVYRAAPKCAWVMNDATYQLVRAAKDSSARPLLNVAEDGEVLMGRKVLISPSVSGKIYFGDLSAIVVHCSSFVLKRLMQLPGYVEYGKYAYLGLMLADAALLDPTGGSSHSPVISASLHV